jgi:hypothetical protein
MSIKTRWPWITLLIMVAALLNPLGLNIIHAAFLSGEALSRNIWQPIALIAIAVLLMMIALERLVRALTLKRRSRGTTTA